MTRCTCPFVLIALLMISTNSADDEISCYFCQNTECLKNKPPKLMDCSTEKMSSKNLVGDAKIVWDLILKGSTDLDDTSKYTKCVRLRWSFRNGSYIVHGYLSGCAPEMVGEETYCDYVDKTTTRNRESKFLIRDCIVCEPDYKICSSYPVFEAEKMCPRCESRSCSSFPEMNCLKEKMSSYSWSGRSKEMWNLLAAGGPELDDPTEYTNCARLDWKNAVGNRTFIWGCAPDMVGKEEYCDYVNKTSMENGYTLFGCNTCHASEVGCKGLLPPWGESNCYMSQNQEQLDTLKIMECSRENMSSSDLTGDAKKLWDLLAPGYRSSTSVHFECFAMVWDRNNGSGFLAGCVPYLSSEENFCGYVYQISEKNNYNMLKCEMILAEDEPRFFEGWEKRKKCYICEDSDCLKPSKILNCDYEPMPNWKNRQADTLWSIISRNFNSNLSHYNQCFGIVEEDATFWGCAPEYVDDEKDKKFCDYVNEMAYTELQCYSCPATEKPCFNSSSSWPAKSTRWKKSNATIVYNHTVFLLIISLVLFKIML